MYYDVNDHLIAVESPEQRWYVASDETGTPLVVFNVHGSVIKLTERTPFGSTVLDTESTVYIGVDFRGGILSPHTGMIHFGGRVYDPSIAQWLTPEWEHLVSRLKNPQDIFVYRFRGNDPISIETEPRYMTSNIKIFFFINVFTINIF
jgi:RHS repeat-associated protein